MKPRENELSEMDCYMGVKDQNVTFQYRADPYSSDFGVKTSYQKFTAVFPDWVKPHRHFSEPNGEFRKMFFGTYQEQLAKYYNSKKCTKIPDYRTKESIKLELIQLAKSPNDFKRTKLRSSPWHQCLTLTRTEAKV